MIAAAAAAVLTFGAGAGASALMNAGCVAAVTGAVLATATQVTAAVPGAMESMGSEGQKAFMFTMMALQVTAAIVSLGTGAASAVNAAKATADAAQQATKTMQIASYVESSAQIAGGSTEVAGGAANIAAAESQADAEYARADLAELGKFLKQLQNSDFAFLVGDRRDLDQFRAAAGQFLPLAVAGLHANVERADSALDCRPNPLQENLKPG